MELPAAWWRPDPLRGVEDVPWRALSGGLGVDDLLRGAAEGEPGACDGLAARLLDEDTVSEATVRAVPFLVELGAGYKVPADTRDRVIFLLAAIALAGAGFTEGGTRRTRRRWNRLGRELPRRQPDLMTQARQAVALGAPKVFDSLGLAEVACSMALAIAVPEVVPQHVVDVAHGIAFAGSFPEPLQESAVVALHLVHGWECDESWVYAIAQGDPELLRAYEEGAFPPYQPSAVTLQLLGFRYAFLAAYGQEGVLGMDLLGGAPVTP
ncbi:hypothetical protein KCV87_19640 [Actinosynnema pretiosum subsp. pretiosum]|uniref:Uncharacterized protein n=1 Tax=Actinosynnema pretiosum subsp. pretiosum TaxID=103721 RepID=A0AA45L1V9_9PSEU|nr:hypothetical protein APASM_0162 [Actinosynnema pretiosum subsp. pretiosum]QUF01761.1 hypothetical protein KCV87_19640 [Actinosynnema pretiosum subsp. pretiosum]